MWEVLQCSVAFGKGIRPLTQPFFAYPEFSTNSKTRQNSKIGLPTTDIPRQTSLIRDKRHWVSAEEHVGQFVRCADY